MSKRKKYVISINIFAGFVFSGLNAVTENAQTIKNKGWHTVTGWNAKDTITKPGIFIKGSLHSFPLYLRKEISQMELH